MQAAVHTFAGGQGSHTQTQKNKEHKMDKVIAKLSKEEKELLLSRLDDYKSHEATDIIAKKRPLVSRMLTLIRLALYRFLPLACVAVFLCQRLFMLFNGDTCLLSQYAVPEFAMELGDCSKCQNVTGAIVIDNITILDFMQNYAYSYNPLLMKRAAEDWPAMHTFSFDFFRSLYKNNPDSLSKDGTDGQFFAYSSGIEDIEQLIEILDSSQETDSVDGNKPKKWYIGWSTDDPVIGAELRKYISQPYFLPGSSVDENVAWIFMGSPGPGASLHVDSVGRTSWQAQISGVKTWSLVPPPECEHVCTKFNVTVNTGDIIVVNTNFWFHGTYIHPGNVSITFGTEFE